MEADKNSVPVIDPLSGSALLWRLAKLRETLDGELPDIVSRH
ncbi:hypothetical protein [Nocardia sp.]|nr:hypothetical protein [Nocardia sp.]